MKLNYKIELINVFELVFNNAVLSIMAGQRAGNLSIRADEFHTLNKKLSCLSAEGIRNEVEQAVEQMIPDFGLQITGCWNIYTGISPCLKKGLFFWLKIMP